MRLALGAIYGLALIGLTMRAWWVTAWEVAAVLTLLVLFLLAMAREQERRWGALIAILSAKRKRDSQIAQPFSPATRTQPPQPSQETRH